MSKSVFQYLKDSLPSQNIADTYSSHTFVAVETDSGCGIAMNMYGDASLEMAKINAFYNVGNDYYEPYENFCTDGIDFDGKTVGVIGHMTGVSRRYGDIAKKIHIFDFNPQGDDLSADMEDEILPSCDIVVITGSAIINETVDHILELSEKAIKIIVGPSVPKCPELLDFGFDRLSGMVVSDTDKMRQHIKEDLPGSPYYFGTPFMIKKR